MQESTSTASAEGVAAYVGIDWADQKHAVALRSADEPAKVEHRLIAHEPEALMDWVGELQQRFGAKGKVLICLEQSRGALIYHLMGYEFLELYPGHGQLAVFRRCSLGPYRSRSGRFARALKNSQLTCGDVTIICETVHWYP
jgi:hypothetical protein